MCAFSILTDLPFPLKQAACANFISAIVTDQSVVSRRLFRLVSKSPSLSNMKQYRCRLVNYRLFNATVDGYRLGVHHEVSFLNTFCQYFSKYIPLYQNWLVTTYLILINFHSTRWGIVKCLKKEFFFGCEPSSFLC